MRSINTEFEKKKLYKYLGKDLVQMFKDYNVIVAGGMITSLFNNKEINDVDVYFRDQKDIVAFMTEIWEGGKWIKCHTNKATMITIDDVDVQLIHYNYFANAEEIFNAFDFTVCMGAFDFQTEQFYFHDDFLKHNSQRVLKFNKNTSFPLISLMRIRKYEEKGYKISKPEFFRIVLTCMNLEIESYEELKDQLGGMYGVGYDQMFADIEEEDFSLERAIDYLANLTVSDDYFNEVTPIEFGNLNDLLSIIVDEPVKWFEHNGSKFIIGYDGRISETYKINIENSVEISIEDAFADRKLVKYVKRHEDGRLISYFDNDFEYKIGEIIIPKNDALYFTKYEHRHDSTYAHREDGVLIEVEIEPNDFIGGKSIDSSLMFKKCKVLRIVDDVKEIK